MPGDVSLHQPHVEPCDRADCRHTRRLLAQSCPLVDLDEATEIIVDLTNQACSTADGLDSMAISAYAEAIDYLAKRGIVEIDHQAGRRVTARWVVRCGECGGELEPYTPEDRPHIFWRCVECATAHGVRPDELPENTDA